MPRTPRSTTRQVFERRLKRFPPILVRLLARDEHGKPMTTRQIADKCGRTALSVAVMSESLDWNGITINTFLRFCDACNVDLLDPKDAHRQELYLTGKVINGLRHSPRFRHLRKDPNWEDYYKPLMQRYIESLKGQHEPDKE